MNAQPPTVPGNKPANAPERSARNKPDNVPVANTPAEKPLTKSQRPAAFGTAAGRQGS